VFWYVIVDEQLTHLKAWASSCLI